MLKFTHVVSGVVLTGVGLLVGLGLGRTQPPAAVSMPHPVAGFQLPTPVAVLAGWHYTPTGGLALIYQDWVHENSGSTTVPASYGTVTFLVRGLAPHATSPFLLPRQYQMDALGLVPTTVVQASLVSGQRSPAIFGEIGWTEPVAVLIAQHDTAILPPSVAARLTQWLAHHPHRDATFWPNPSGLGL